MLRLFIKSDCPMGKDHLMAISQNSDANLGNRRTFGAFQFLFLSHFFLFIDRPSQIQIFQQFLVESVCFCPLFSVSFSGSTFLELLRGLCSHSFLFRSKETLKEAFFVSDDSSLIIDLLLIVYKSIPSHFFLLILDLLGNEMPYEKTGTGQEVVPDVNQQLFQVAYHILKPFCLIFLQLDAESFKVESCSVQYVLYVSNEVVVLSLQLFQSAHLEIVDYNQTKIKTSSLIKSAKSMMIFEEYDMNGLLQ